MIYLIIFIVLHFSPTLGGMEHKVFKGLRFRQSIDSLDYVQQLVGDDVQQLVDDDVQQLVGDDVQQLVGDDVQQLVGDDFKQLVGDDV